MRVLLISVNLNERGGIQKYIADVVNVLQEKVEVQYVMPRGRSVVAKIRFVMEVVIKSILFHPNAIICCHINFAPIGYWINKLGKIPYAVLTYGIEVWNLNKTQIGNLKKAKGITTISSFTKNKLVAADKELGVKIVMLPNAIEGKRFEPREKSKDLIKKLGLENKKVVCTIGRLTKSEGYKGYDKIIQALPLIAREIKNIAYVLGGTGDDLERIQKLIQEKGVEQHVIMPGFIPEGSLVDYYNSCDVFAMPSKGEGFGFVFIEALACGIPVIAGNQDGSVDAVLGGEVGILVNPDDINEIKRAIVDVLSKKAPSQILNKEVLRTKILEAYGLDKFKEKVQYLLDELQR